MEKNQLIFKVSRLLPSSLSSCHFRTLPDVAQSSIPITKSNVLIPPENDHSNSSFNKKPQIKHKMINSSTLPKPCKRTPFEDHYSDAEGRKCPPATPISTLLNSNKKEKPQQNCRRKSSVVSANTSISSNSSSRWFTSSDDIKTRGNDDVETDTFFSLSSNSGDSFRLKTSRRFRGRREEMKSIDETGRCSFSSAASFDTVLSKTRRKTATSVSGKTTGEKSSSETCPEYGDDQIGSEHVFSTQLYYQKNSCRKNIRRRKKANNLRKTRKDGRMSFNHVSSVIEESYAVEKCSNDPHGDFRASMVEMIVEKQIFGADDLERLLLCFLSLNAVSYHEIIYDVFSEICQTLFCNS